MQDPYVDNQTILPYEDRSAQNQGYAPYQFAPGQMQGPPAIPPDNHRHSKDGVRTGAIIAVALILILVFGIGIFAGGQFARSPNTGTTPGVFHSATTPL